MTIGDPVIYSTLQIDPCTKMTVVLLSRSACTKPSLFDLGPTCGSSDVVDVTRTNTSTPAISTLTTITGVVSIVGYDVV